VPVSLSLAAFFSTHTLDRLLSHYGYAAVGLFVMIESLGVPFPGETMIITAALYAGTTGHLDPWLIWAAAATGAIVGDNIGFAIGWWGGYRLLVRFGPKIHLNEAKLKVGRLVFERYGGRVVFFGRFVSILRTYAAFLAGSNRMEYVRFLGFNAAGGILWATLYGFGGYALGNNVHNLTGPVGIASVVLAVLAIGASLVVLRKNEQRLEEEAERAMPGPLDMSRSQRAHS
jgi:membrane protein DedA with SNARE-associated domain